MSSFNRDPVTLTTQPDASLFFKNDHFPLALTTSELRTKAKALSGPWKMVLHYPHPMTEVVTLSFHDRLAILKLVMSLHNFAPSDAYLVGKFENGAVDFRGQATNFLRLKEDAFAGVVSYSTAITVAVSGCRPASSCIPS